MSRKTNLKTSLFATVAAVGLLAPASALATNHSDVVQVDIRDGENAGTTDRRADGRERPEQQVGTGAEQCSSTQLASGEILTFCISSYYGVDTDIEGDGIPERTGDQGPRDRMQLLCSSMTIDPIAGPQVQKTVFVTNTDGDRYRNGMHPETAAIWNNQAAQVTFNYAPNNDVNDNGLTCNAQHACAFSRIIGSGCVAMSAPGTDGMGDLIQAHNNDNCSERAGAGAVVQNGAISQKVEWHGCNGNGRDDAWVASSTTTCDAADPDGNGYACDTAYDWEVSVLNDEERSRGDCFFSQSLTTSRGRPTVLCYGTAGNTQPPNRGVAGYALDVSPLQPDGTPYPNVNDLGQLGRLLYANDGGRRNGQYIMESVIGPDGNRIYRTEIRCSPDASDDVLICRYQDGMGRGGNKKKGAYANRVAGVKFGANSLSVMNVATQVAEAVDVTHGHMFATLWGETGSEQLKHIHLSGVHIGSSTGSMQGVLMGWDPEARSVVEEAQYNLRAAFDSAWISNIYGQNPNTQGRNFIGATTVMNPGYGIEGGYMSDVKSFIGIPATVRRLRAEPEPGMDYRINEDKLALEYVLVPAVIDPAPSSDPGTDPGSETNPEDPNSNEPTTYGGGGCAVSTTSGGMSSLAALAFALFFVIRRRRR